MTSDKIDFRSPCCNADVHRDAFAAWDFHRQHWDLASVTDRHVCCSCGEPCDPVEIAVPITASG